MKRQCGDCQLCCKLLPVHDDEPWRPGDPIHKAANERCPHQKYGVGCAIYAARPYCCKIWFCRWVVNDEAGDLPRPDRAHYVIDMMPDEIQLTDNTTGEITKATVVVVWVDPAYRDEVMRDRKLRAWLARKAEQGFPALFRFSERDAVGAFAPVFNEDGEWHFKGGEINERVGLWNKRR
jgi:hypothetical protein